MQICTLYSQLSCAVPKNAECQTLAVVWNGRFGSKADICSARPYVRFAPESGIKCNKMGCLLWANSGHRAVHSISSSTRAGTVLPAIAAKPPNDEAGQEDYQTYGDGGENQVVGELSGCSCVRGKIDCNKHPCSNPQRGSDGIEQ